MTLLQFIPGDCFSADRLTMAIGWLAMIDYDRLADNETGWPMISND